MANPQQRQVKERKYKERNPDKYKAKRQRQYQSAKRRDVPWYKYNPDVQRERDRKRWRENPKRREYDRERWQRRRETYNQQARERYSANPWPKRLSELRHRTLKKSAPGAFTRDELLAKFSYWAWRCRYCRCELSAKTATLDHRIPLHHGGTNWLANIVPACKSCNSSKRIKREDEFIAWRAANALV